MKFILTLTSIITVGCSSIQRTNESICNYSHQTKRGISSMPLCTNFFPEVTTTQLRIKNTDMTLNVSKFKIKNARGRIIITHGILEHSGRYKHVVKELNRKGFNVVTYDLRGHGLSKGEKAFVKDFSNFVSDLNQVFEYSLQDSTDLPTIMLGHSMGGLISYLHSTQESMTHKAIKGYVLLAPAISPPPLSYTQKLTSFIGQGLRKISPYRSEDVALASEDLMTDVDLQKKHKEDSQVQSKATISLLLELFAKSKVVAKGSTPSSLPTLILQGDKDKVVDWQQNIEVAKALKSKSSSSVEYQVIPGEKHELLNSKTETREEIFSKIFEFIDNVLE